MPQPAIATDEIGPDSEFADPVFVLCNGRSGSTLLRFLLDAHPELACPPETNLPALCAQLATVWSLIEGAPLSANRGDEPPVIPDAAIAGIRHTMNRMVGSYLERRGKARYCDKSLGTARFAELLLRIYPQARFICLYRHPMDVIASGIEACPWGLNGYGFDQYIATSPGNVVNALARFWVDNAMGTMAVEERFADKCIRVRYEDLVEDPEAVASRIFAFLGVPPAPGISEACFSSQRERHGPGDNKIWFTSKVSTESIGRGWSVPMDLIGPPLETINGLAKELSYLPIGEDWGSSEPPADVRLFENVDGTSQQTEGQPRAVITSHIGRDAPSESVTGLKHSQMLGTRLLAGIAAIKKTADWLGPHGTETFVAVSISQDVGQLTEYWLVNLKERTVTFVDRAAQENSDWDIIGSTDIWVKVMEGKTNLSVALRSCQLRYCGDDDPDPFAAETRIAMLANLFALVNWQ